MSIRKRGRRSYQVRVSGFPAQTAPTREAAEKIELDVRRRKALGDLYEAPAMTLGEAIDGTLARINATRGVSDKTRAYNSLSAKFWAPLRKTKVPTLRRAKVEDMIFERAKQHPRSAKNELELLKRVLHDAKGRGQRVDEAIFEIPPVKHRARKGRGLTVSEFHELASWFPEQSSRLILLAGQVGCRQNVWFHLTEEMLDLKAGTLTIPAALAKRGLEHRIYLTELEVKLLREQLLVRADGDDPPLPHPGGKALDGEPVPRSCLAALGRGGVKQRREPARGRVVRVRRVHFSHAAAHGGVADGARRHGSGGGGGASRAQ